MFGFWNKEEENQLTCNISNVLAWHWNVYSSTLPYPPDFFLSHQIAVIDSLTGKSLVLKTYALLAHSFSYKHSLKPGSWALASIVHSFIPEFQGQCSIIWWKQSLISGARWQDHRDWKDEATLFHVL